MNKEEAREWVRARFGIGGVAALERFAALLASGAREQNLIAIASLEHLWTRHLVDSAQLAGFSKAEGIWLDIGTGGGMPGLVLSLLLDRPFVLCEPRRLRAEFLRRCAAELGVSARVTVAECKVERLSASADTISARAVAPLDRLLASARHCASPKTEWILPRGQSGREELEHSAMLRSGMFHVEHSITDQGAVIVLGCGVAAL